MNGLDLFTGIGGITYALQDWIRPVAYCEIEPFCQSVLLSRMQEEHLPKAPIWDDVRTFQGSFWHRDVDIIYGGFPCQDISVAGRGAGLDGERSGLFFEILRLAKEIQPKFIFLENVPAITSRGGLQVVREIASLGYDCRWCVISAASVGAMHKRERWFLLANSKHNGTLAYTPRRSIGERPISRQRTYEQAQSIREIERASCLYADVANTQGKRLEGFGRESSRSKKELSKSAVYGEDDGNSLLQSGEQADKISKSYSEEWNPWRGSSGLYRPFESRDDWQKVVSEMGKCSDGISNHVDRLKSLGNAVVPQQVRRAWEILLYGK